MAAREVALPTGSRAKVRDEGLVVLWTVLTLGIYTTVWYYRINREMRDFGRAHGDEKLANTNPVLSLLAVTLGGLLIVPAVVSYWRTTGRVRRVQEQCNVTLTEGWVVGLLLVAGLVFVLPWIAIPPYVQSGLNKVWTLYPPAEGDQVEVAPAPAAAPAAPTTPPSGEVPAGKPPDPSDRLS